jgi:hypothetical protein
MVLVLDSLLGSCICAVAVNSNAPTLSRTTGAQGILALLRGSNWQWRLQFSFGMADYLLLLTFYEMCD